MNKIFYIILSVILIISCNKDVGTKAYEGKNYVYFSLLDGRSNLTIEDTQRDDIEFVIKTTAPLKNALTLFLELSGEAVNEFKTVNPIPIKMNKGDFELHFTITPQFNTNLIVKRSIQLKLKSESSELILPEKSFEIRIIPSPQIELTERESLLIESYKEKYGIDIYPFLGRQVCNGEILWAGFKEGDYNYPKLVAERRVPIVNQVMIVGISAKATEDKIILEFKHNALGQNIFMRELWENLTILDEAYWNNPDPAIQPPNPKIIRETINWSKETANNESFDVQLDNVRINPQTGTITFTDKKSKSVKYSDYPYDDELTSNTIVVPFHYETSVWRRILDITKQEPLFKEQVYGGDMNIYEILNNAGIKKDMLAKEGITQTRYIKPSGKIDFNTHTMSFDYPFYVRNSDRYSITHISIHPLL